MVTRQKMDSCSKDVTKCTNLDLERAASGNSKSMEIDVNHTLKQAKKIEIQGRSPASTINPLDSGNSKSWICKNFACKAVLSMEDAFCKRCSCCICHQFDDNKDPTLWLVCGSESSDLDLCGSSCHVECSIQQRKAGVANLGESLQIDGSYCCASCGKVSGLLGFWKKQLVIARDARRVDILCYRVSLSYRLLEGTNHFKSLHEVVSEAKSKLEAEVGPIGGVSAKMARGIVSRLSMASDIQKLCSLAIDMVDEWMSFSTLSTQDASSSRWDSLPAACRFHFEDITPTSVLLMLRGTVSAERSNVEGYKLWYWKSRDQGKAKMVPVIFPKDQKRILVSDLQPCTEYTFKIISYAESGDVGHSESKCFTRSVELMMNHNKDLRIDGEQKSTAQQAIGSRRMPPPDSAGFKVRDLGKILRLAWAHEHGRPRGNWTDSDNGVLEGEHCNGLSSTVASCGLNLNVLSTLGMNPELLAFLGSSNTSDNTRSGDYSEDSQNWASALVGSSGEEEMHQPSNDAYDDLDENNDDNDDAVMLRKRRREREGQTDEYDGDNMLVSRSLPVRTPLCGRKLDERYEECVRMVRWLECEGHVRKDFRMKFLTWYSLRSTEQERRVVHTYIDTLIDDPPSLAGQLLDSFSGIVSCRHPWDTGSCTELCTASKDIL